MKKESGSTGTCTAVAMSSKNTSTSSRIYNAYDAIKKSGGSIPDEHHDEIPSIGKFLKESIDHHIDSQVQYPKEVTHIVEMRLDFFTHVRLFCRDMLHPEHTSSLIRLFFNGILGAVLCFLLIAFYMTAKEDLMKKRAQEMDAIIMEINQCRREYFDNRCEPDLRTSAVEEFCQEKELCMNQDPMAAVQDIKTTATLIAEILNEFIVPLHWKTIIVFFCVILSLILFNFSVRSPVYYGKSREKSDWLAAIKKD